MIEQGLLILGRLVRAPVVHTVAAMATLPVTAAGMNAIGLTTDVHTVALANGLVEGSLWMTLGMAALFGGLGGVVAELLSLHGHIEVPHRVRRGTSARRARLSNPRYEVDLGILSRLVLGGAAGVALLALYAPPNATALVVNALIAGSAATGFLRLAQGRLLAKDKPSAVSSRTSAANRQAAAGRAADGAVPARTQLSVVPEQQQTAIA
jgi:hypothetical protein